MQAYCLHMQSSTGSLLTPQEAAQHLGVTARTLRRYVRQGKLTRAERNHLGYARFRREDLDALLCQKVAS